MTIESNDSDRRWLTATAPAMACVAVAAWAICTALAGPITRQDGRPIAVVMMLCGLWLVATMIHAVIHRRQRTAMVIGVVGAAALAVTFVVLIVALPDHAQRLITGPPPDIV